MKTLRAIAFIVLIILANPVGSNAQAWQYSEEFGTDFFTSQLDRKIEVVNCNTGTSEMKSIGTCMRKDVANGFSNGYVIKSKMPNLNGLNAKVARGVAASRPKRTASTGTYKYSTGRAGTSKNHATSQEHIDWVHQRQESIRLAQEKKREEERRRRIEDEIRVAAATAAANARLQSETDQRIQNDRYNAGQGALAARQQARQAIQVFGPRLSRSQTSASEKAKMLRGQNKPRHVMYPQRQPRNTARKPLAKVERRQLTPQQEIMLKRALMVRAELRRKNAAEKKWNEYKGIKLSDGAVSTLGKDWQSDDFKTGPLAPPPLSPRRLAKHKDMLELLGEPPLTSEEEIRLLKEHEFLGV